MLNDAKRIAFAAIDFCKPQEAVKKALADLNIAQEVYLVAAGKAAFSMAKAASEVLPIRKGILITKYGHVQGRISGVDCYEAGHPVMDENSIRASEKVIEMCSSLKKEDIVVFLLSGGASALFESPLVDLKTLQRINRQLLEKGLNIVEINTIRKKLSKIKGGHFGDLCKPAKVYSIILSDVLSDRLDSIGSGPTARDESDGSDALKLIGKYGIEMDEKTRMIIARSKAGDCSNCENRIIGSVRILCQKAMEEAQRLGYKPVLISDQIGIEAREAGDLLFAKIREYQDAGENIALIMGGETIVHVKGKGLGGRNQELVFSQLKNLSGMKNILILSIGSDGTDGPTDAAGAYADGGSYEKFLAKNGDFESILADNDTYHGLELIDGLIKTGPTQTNVNDLTIALIRKG